MLRLIRFVALVVLCVSLAVLPVIGFIFWPVIGFWFSPPRRVSAPVKAIPAPAAAAAAPPVVVAEPPPPRKGNRPWADVERTFENRRVPEDDNPAWRDNLFATYQMVANPAFTDSTELKDHREKLSQWRKEFPDSATPLVALARAHIDWAWDARGPWIAAGVPRDAWQPFYERLSEARQLLNQAVEIGVKDAEAYRLLVIIARAEGWPEEEARATLAEGQRVDSLYYPLYIEFARYLLPRWHGKRGDVERFAAEMTERLPGDDGLEAFARIAAAIHQIDVERELLFLGSYDRDLLVKASEVLRQRHEGQYDEASFAALCAWVAQDREAGRRLFSHIGQSEENDGVWPWAQHKREFRHWCKDDDFQLTGETQWLWGSVFDAENLVFAPDSRSIWCGAGYSPAAAKRIDIEERRVTRALPGSGEQTTCLVVDEDQRFAAAAVANGPSQGLMIWNFDNIRQPVRIAIKDLRCLALAANPADAQIALATERTIRIFHARTGKLEASFDAPQHTRHVQFSADGKRLIVSAEHPSILDVKTGQRSLELPSTSMRPVPDIICERVLDIDSDGRMLAFLSKIKPGPRKSMLVRYQPDGQSWETLIPELTDPLVIPHLAVVSADRGLLATIRIQQGKRVPHLGIEVWDIAAAKKIKEFGGHCSRITTMAFSPDGKWLASMGFPTGLVKLWPLADVADDVRSKTASP